MNEVQTLIDEIGKRWGWEVGDKVRQEINAVISAQDVDIDALQSAIQTIQSLLDADPSTEEFDVGQNIVTQLSDHLNRITGLETDITRLNGDEATVGSVAYAVKQERDRATSVEGELHTEIDSVETGAGLNDDGSYTANTDASYIADATSLKDADDKLDAAIKSLKIQAAAQAQVAEENAKDYADDTFVTKEQLADISAATLASIFRQALDCGFSGESRDDVLNGTGNCATASGDGEDNDGDGAVL